MALTEEQCKQNDNIPTEEIKQDIIDTQMEIGLYEDELIMLGKDRVGNKVPIYMNQGRISKRKTFIENLNSILEYRTK